MSSKMLQAGIGLRAQHYEEVITTRPNIGWFEVHSENYFGKGGKPHYYLEKITQNYPISFHGVGLSLGSADELNFQHLDKIKKIIDRYAPIFVSEHLSWSGISAHHLHDLLPLPYTQESLDLLVNKVDQVQEYLNRQILIENTSSYLQFSHSTFFEHEFISELSKRTGCGILLDINNLYVNSVNHGWDAEVYLQNIPVHCVHEIHLAGFTEKFQNEKRLLIDTHDQLISTTVWQLYAKALQRFGCKPTLIEWDKNIPALSVLMEETKKANKILENVNAIVV